MGSAHWADGRWWRRMVGGGRLMGRWEVVEAHGGRREAYGQMGGAALPVSFPPKFPN